MNLHFRDLHYNRFVFVIVYIIHTSLSPTDVMAICPMKIIFYNMTKKININIIHKTIINQCENNNKPYNAI